jgi:polyisoprenoid-binding protein YceI
MRRLALIPALGIAALLALAAPLSAAPVRFDSDPPHSQASFTIRHFFSKVPGRFKEMAVTIMLDEQNLANSSVEATIQAASIFTNNDYRDKDLRSSNFFAVDSFPTITFKSTKVTPGENGKLRIEGNLTMRGITKPIVLDGAFLGAGALDMSGYSAGYRAGFEATTTLNRKDFNIVWNQTLDQGGTMLGDDVAISIGIEAKRVEPDKAGGTPPAGKKPGK